MTIRFNLISKSSIDPHSWREELESESKFLNFNLKLSNQIHRNYRYPFATPNDRYYTGKQTKLSMYLYTTL